MTNAKPRENQRKDIWFTDEDMELVRKIEEEMKEYGYEPRRQGKFSLSEIVRYALINATEPPEIR